MAMTRAQYESLQWLPKGEQAAMLQEERDAFGDEGLDAGITSVFDLGPDGGMQFSDEVDNPNSNVEKTETITTSADGTKTKVIKENKQNTPSFKGQQEQQVAGGVKQADQKNLSPAEISAFDVGHMGAGDPQQAYNPEQMEANKQRAIDLYNAEQQAQPVQQAYNPEQMEANKQNAIDLYNAEQQAPFGTSYSGGATQSEFDKAIQGPFGTTFSGGPTQADYGNIPQQAYNPEQMEANKQNAIDLYNAEQQAQPVQQAYNPEQMEANKQNAIDLYNAEQQAPFGTSYSGGPTQADYVAPQDLPPGEVYTGEFDDPWAAQAEEGPLNRRQKAARERALSTEGGNTDISGFGRTPMTEHRKEQIIRDDIVDAAVAGIDRDQFDTGRGGTADFKDAKEQAGQEALSEFDKDLLEAEKALTDDPVSDVPLAEIDVSKPEFGLGPNEEQKAFNKKHGLLDEMDPKKGEETKDIIDQGGSTAQAIINAAKSGIDSGSFNMGDYAEKAMSWYKSNPILANALISAAANYIQTGNAYSAIGAGFAGGKSALDAGIKSGAALAKEQRAEAKWNRQEDAKQKDRLELAGYKAAIKTGKVPTARETSKANEAYAKGVSDEFSAMVPGEQKNLYRTAFNSGNVAKTMSAIKKRYGIDMLEATPEQHAAFKQAAVDLLEANTRTIARGGKNPKLDTNMFKYYENNVIRSTAIDKGIPVGSFDTIDTGDINKEQMKKAFMKIQQARGLKDQSDTDLWKIAYSNYNALSDSDKSDLAKAGAKNNMSPFLYFVNVEATFVAK